jgi:hypothetical protein
VEIIPFFTIYSKIWFPFPLFLYISEILISHISSFPLVVSGSRPFQLQDVFSLENEESEDMATLIDKKVC